MDEVKSLEMLERFMQARVYEYGGGPRFADLFRPAPDTRGLPEAEQSPNPVKQEDADLERESPAQENVPVTA